MVIGFDTRPLSNLSSSRGIGVYTTNLLNNLSKIDDLEIIPITKGKLPNNVDLIHYPYFDIFFPTLPLRTSKPEIVTIHDLTPLVLPELYPSGIKGQLTFLRQKFALKKIKAIITDSISSRKDIINFLNVPAEKVFYVPLAAQEGISKIDNKIEISVKSKYNLPKNYCLYVGDINRNKNIPSLIQACKNLNIHLIIIGKQAVSKDFDTTHVENADLVYLQKEANYSSSIIKTLGFIPTEELSIIYNKALALVMPSLYEGFGIPILEAMSCGCPVICSKNGSLPEVAGDSAVYCNTDVKSIIKALNFVMNLSDGQRLLIIQAGLEHAKKFSWSTTAEKTFQIYKQVLNFRI